MGNNAENPIRAPIRMHEGPQHAYDAAPGTITGWAVSPTCVLTLAAELSHVVSIKGHFDQLFLKTGHLRPTRSKLVVWQMMLFLETKGDVHF